MSVAANIDSLQREWEDAACAPVHEQPGRTLALLGRLIDILADQRQNTHDERPVGFVQHPAPPLEVHRMTQTPTENDVAWVLSKMIDAVGNAPDIDELIADAVEQITRLAGFKGPR